MISTKEDRAGYSLSYVIVIGFWLLSCFVLMLHEPPGNAAKYAALEMGQGVDDRADFQADVNAAPLFRKVGFLSLVVLGAYCLATGRRELRIANYPLLIVTLCLFIWLYISYFWAQSPRESAMELVRFTAWMMAAIGIARKFEPKEMVILFTIVGCGSAAIAGLTDVFTGEFRPWRSGYRLTGTLHPNGVADVAVLMSVCALFLATQAGKHQRVWLIVVAVGFCVVFLTRSRNGLLCYLAGLYFLMLIGRPLAAQLKMLCVTALLVGAVMVLSGVVSENQRRTLMQSAAMGRTADSKLSGRTDLWHALLRSTNRDRLQGVGYGSFFVAKRVERLGSQLGWFPHHAHNVYVEVLISLGGVGLSLVVLTGGLTLLECLKRFNRDSDDSYRLFATLLLVGAVQGTLCVAYLHPRGLLLLTAAIVFSCIVISRQTLDDRPPLNTKPLF